MGLQSHKRPNFGNFETPKLGVAGQKWHLGASPMTKHRLFIRGKVVVPPSLGRGESCEFVFAHGSSMHQKCSDYGPMNLLFDFCRFVWIIDPLVTHPSLNPRALARPSTFKMLQARERTLTPSSIVSIFGLAFESLKECGGASLDVSMTMILHPTHSHVPLYTQMITCNFPQSPQPHRYWCFLPLPNLPLTCGILTNFGVNK
jgi:hypothetical protein